VGEDELEKLLRHGEGWLASHPEKEVIVKRYLKYQHGLAREALERLADEDQLDPDAVQQTHLNEELAIEEPLRLWEQRLGAVVAMLKASGAKRILDLGCGEGKLLRELLDNKQFDEILGMDVSFRSLEIASERLHLDRLPPVQKQLIQARNLLSVLLGRTPSEINIPNFELVDLKLPQELPLTVPSKLVEQRPDIRASESLLHQASAQVGVATAAQFPTFNLSGSLTSNTPDPGSLTFFTPESFAWTLIASTAAPIFRGGTLEAQKLAAIANYDRANASYRGVVLNAFANVANVLAALQLDAETLRVQLYAEQTAEQSLQITQERFQAGAIAYLSLLDAQRTYQQARIALVIAQASRYADTVALFQSLGGGWWNRQDFMQASESRYPPPP